MLLLLWWTTETRKASLLQWKTCGIRCGILFEGALRHPTGWDFCADYCRLLHMTGQPRQIPCRDCTDPIHLPHRTLVPLEVSNLLLPSIGHIPDSDGPITWEHVSEKQWESWETSCYRADKNHLRFFAQDFSALLHLNSDLKEDSSFWWTRYWGHGWMQRLPAWRSNPTARHGVRLAISISTPRSNMPRSNQIGHRYAIYMYIYIDIHISNYTYKSLGLYKVLTRGSASNMSK